MWSAKLRLIIGKQPTQRSRSILKAERREAQLIPSSSIGIPRGREGWWRQALCRDALIFLAEVTGTEEGATWRRGGASCW
jgi:hypothetical protein